MSRFVYPGGVETLLTNGLTGHPLEVMMLAGWAVADTVATPGDVAAFEISTGGYTRKALPAVGLATSGGKVRLTANDVVYPALAAGPTVSAVMVIVDDVLLAGVDTEIEMSGGKVTIHFASSGFVTWESSMVV